MLTFLAALAVSAAATPVAAAAARRLGFLDRPVPGLKEHARPVPYLGGGAVAAGVAAGVCLAAGGWPGGEAGTVLLAASMVLLLGLIDDARPMGPGMKAVGQAAAAAVLIAGGVHLRVEAFPLWLNLGMTFFWVLAATNAVNIIDIMDGLAASVSAAAAAAFAAILLRSGDAAAAALPLALAGACLGFLPWNRRPARIYLGDAGALTIGFLLSATAILGSYTAWNDVAFLAPVVVLGVPLFDTFLVMSLRLFARRSPFRGSKDHLALRLRAAGLSVDATVAVLAAVSVALAGAALAVTFSPLETAFVVYTLVALAALLAAVWASSRAAVGL